MKKFLTILVLFGAGFSLHAGEAANFQKEAAYKAVRPLLIASEQAITKALAKGAAPVSEGFKPNEAFDALVELGKLVASNPAYSAYVSGDRSWTGGKASTGAQEFALQLFNGDADMKKAVGAVAKRFGQGNDAQAFNLYTRISDTVVKSVPRGGGAGGPKAATLEEAAEKAVLAMDEVTAKIPADKADPKRKTLDDAGLSKSATALLKKLNS